MQCISCYSSVIPLFRCKGCRVTFTKESVWEVHARLTGHLCDSYFTCECRYKPSDYDYEFHFQCPLCGKQCASQGGLSNHENSCQIKNKVLLYP